MRHTLITTALLAGTLALPAYAAVSVATCGEYSEIAGKIMQARQNNAPMRELAGAADTGDEATDDLMIAMVQDAYDVPRFNSPRYQQNAVRDFENDIFATCMENM